MGYIEESLGQNETLHYRAYFHWFYYASAIAALVVSALVAILALSAQTLWISIIALLIGLAIAASIYIPIWATEIGVTNQRFIYKRGWLNRVSNELQLSSIEEVRYSQDFWGRIFDFGHLEIHGTGDDAILLPAVADPIELRAALQEAIGISQGDPPPVEEALEDSPNNKDRPPSA